MKKIFFDCGTHLFQGFNQFSQKYSIDQDWECYCFEANPITYQMSKSNYFDLLNQGFDIKHFNVAVTDKRGFVDVNCGVAYFYDESEEGSFTSQASNILKNPPNPPLLCYDENIHKVRSIDFSDFMKQVTSPDDFVLIKMDIEGSEFSVLDKLIYDNNLLYINNIHIEFHEHFFDDIKYYSQRKDFYTDLFKSKNITFENWI
jgi:FkbM family methyltransferase